jgi:hypothetical protein
MKAWLKQSDRTLSHSTEDVVRRLSRRDFVSRSVKRAAAITAGLSLGSLAGLTTAQAGSCTCIYPNNCNCNTCGGLNCPDRGCPPSCTKCRDTDCGVCIYADADWVCCSNCCGPEGDGHKLCYDCKCPGCGNTCGCKSNCIGGSVPLP